jgi:hypothetical protein
MHAYDSSRIPSDSPGLPPTATRMAAREFLAITLLYHQTRMRTTPWESSAVYLIYLLMQTHTTAREFPAVHLYYHKAHTRMTAYESPAAHLIQPRGKRVRQLANPQRFTCTTQNPIVC